MNDTRTNIRYSEEIRDVVDAVPPWILRSGISMLFILLVLAGFLASFIKFPDVINCQLKIDAYRSPKSINAKVSGRISSILVNENSMVQRGQQLAFIESTANPRDVLKIKQQLDSVRRLLTSQQTSVITLPSGSGLQLGELQQSYQQFYTHNLSFQRTAKNGLFKMQLKMAQADLNSLNQQNIQLQAQEKIQKEELELAAKEFEMHSTLLKEKVETPAEYRQQKIIFLAKRTPLIQTESSILALYSQITSKRKELLNITNQVSETRTDFLVALSSLLSEIEAWCAKYILTAPEQGKVLFADEIQTNSLLQGNQEAFYIYPESGGFFGKIDFPQNSISKVKLHQQVLIKLKGYAFQEYGILHGTISSISEIPGKNGSFLIKTQISDNQKFFRVNKVQLKEGLTADAQIVTRDKTLLDRFFHTLRPSEAAD